jgi:DNA-binding NarL/FixJ family response regulator
MPLQARPLAMLLVEMDTEVHRAIRAAVVAEPAFRLMAICSNKHEAIRIIHARAPDIALVGLKLPDGSGLEVVEAVKRRQPASSALVIGTSDDRDGILSAMEAGATGFLWKEALLRPRATCALSMLPRLSFARGQELQSVDMRAKVQVELADLTSVQRQILHCLLQGLSNKEIARDLILTTYNVDYHLKCLRKRFSAHNRVQLVGVAQTLFRS